MTALSTVTLADVGIDAVALKPAEVDPRAAADLAVETLAIDYEGRANVPDREILSTLSERATVRLTTPVRANGYDPLGDDSALDTVPDAVERVLVAGHSAYLTDAETERAVAPRLRAAAADAADPWVGTAGIERLALAVGGTQYELLSRSTERDIRALRAAGFDGDVAVYAPFVLAEDTDAILDAVGAYAARRRSVGRALPDGAPTDSAASGRAREVLEAGVRDYALVGAPDVIVDRTDRLREAGVDTVVGYPARGLGPLLG
ncbi:DUF7388 family protein [Haloarcula amylovorans]|uniref:DUF7388 family protein n=1 Tax=Haloarcula amylovorans TaxID=2562280 RepID=UPI0010768809|nr:luciferase [Halomicroarcula amylolytica]